MARPSSPPILAQIRNSRSSSEQVIALRALKNDIIGHQLKKEMWVGLGVVEPIVRIMASNKTHGKQNSKIYDHHCTYDTLSDKEMVRLQALCVIGSLAHGGPPFLGPLHSASVLPAILSNICPSNNPPQLVLSALRALSNLADSVSLASSAHPLNASILADSLFSRPHINSICKILSQSSSASIIRSHISLAASLISRLCRDERHQMSLANAGVLDALATRLASIVVSQGLVIPGAELVAQKEGLLDWFPSPAPRNADLSGILEAIAVIIADSKFRASQLVYSNAIMAVFPTSPTEFQPNRSTKVAWNASNAVDLSARQSRLSALDYLIPHIPLNRIKSSSAFTTAFPPLGTPGSHEHLVQLGGSRIPAWSRTPSFESGMVTQDNISAEPNDPESPLVPYLIWLTRSTRPLERLMAASVLTVLYRAGLTDKSRETALGLLIVPVLVQLLRDEKIDVRSDEDTSLTLAERVALDWKIKERTPAVLAMLIVDSEYLQKSAYDSNVISKLAEMIKAAYEPVLEGSDSRAWSPSIASSTSIGSSSTSQNMRSGLVGQSPLLVHKIRVRESTLRAIAALVPLKDEYRKAVIDQGVVPYIVESLKSYPDKPSAKANEKAEKSTQVVEGNKFRSPGYGTNPVSVLIAACGAVRHLSRSVSILRTTLIDIGVVMPVFALLQHPDIDVQISATATTCNLVMDFSPMRETIAAAGVLKILCEHAHSGNVKLRLNALWALKHLVQSAGNDVKKTCLEELGQGWLVQLICDDTEDEALLSAKSKSGGFRFNEGAEDDIHIEQFEDEDESRVSAPVGTLAHTYSKFDGKASNVGSQPASSRAGYSHIVNARLAALRDLETNPARRARKDDIAVQEQGLDFIRNLIGGFNNGGTSETSEMIDFLLNAFQDQIFEILASKLKFRIINPYKRNSTGSGETRLVPPQAEIIAAVEYILVHMAASVPRHRQLVISQTDLLKLLVLQFNNPSKEVRLALCWLVINLTWVDDAHDGQACAQRAQELKKLGFLAKLESLENDVELDVRERAKTAVWQMKQGYGIAS